MTREETRAELIGHSLFLSAADLQTVFEKGANLLSDWRQRGRIFGVPAPDGDFLYPKYQFDASMQPLAVVATVLQAFGPVSDPWLLLAWFHYPNGWLSRKDESGRPQAPKDLLDDRDALLRAARRHGDSYVA